jgi:hypothetical protein
MGTVRVKEDALSAFLKAAEVLKVCGLAESSKSKAKTSPNTSAADNQNDETSVLASSHHPFNDHCADVGSVSNFNSFPLFSNDSKMEPNINSSEVSKIVSDENTYFVCLINSISVLIVAKGS